MKIVINGCYGGFGLSKEAVAELGRSNCGRQDVKLIELIETKGSEYCSGSFAALEVVSIPDESTDWEIIEYDGAEYVLYVLDGKIHYACE